MSFGSDEMRALYFIKGPSVRRVLQGLTTQNLSKFAECSGSHVSNFSETELPVRVGLPTLFLKPNGRILFNVLLYDLEPYNSGEPRFLIDVPKERSAHLENYLRKHMLRESFALQDVTADFRLKIRPPNHESSDGRDSPTSKTGRQRKLGREENFVSFVAPDLRYWRMGSRVYESVRDRKIYPSNSAPELSSVQRSLSLGVQDTVDATDSLPLSLNMDWLGYLATNKGCYVGQEHINRSLHQAETRRRLVIVIGGSENARNKARLLEPGQPISRDSLEEKMSDDLDEIDIGNMELVIRNIGAQEWRRLGSILSISGNIATCVAKTAINQVMKNKKEYTDTVEFLTKNCTFAVRHHQKGFLTPAVIRPVPYAYE